MRKEMLEWYIEVADLLQKTANLAEEARRAYLEDENGKRSLASMMFGPNKLSQAKDELRAIWEKGGRDIVELSATLRHLDSDSRSLDEALKYDLPHLVELSKQHIRKNLHQDADLSFAELLHPEIQRHALHHYIDGDFREAVLNSVLAITEMIRKATGLQLDGVQLATETFSINRPRLVFSDIDTDSGRSDQQGFMQIFIGMYTGIRNPKAHTLNHDLNKVTAAQYLIFASLLARRVDEAGPAVSQNDR